MQSRIGPWKVSQSWSLAVEKDDCKGRVKEAMLLIEDEALDKR